MKYRTLLIMFSKIKIRNKQNIGMVYKYQMYTTTLRNFAPFHPTSFFLDKHCDNYIEKYYLIYYLFYINF